MSERVHQPQFWLEVKKEYVVENFEQLLPYLRDYRYVDVGVGAHKDFDTTCEQMKSVVDDLFRELADATLYRCCLGSWVEKPDFNIRLIAAYLLTAQKRGENPSEHIASLSDLLLQLNMGQESCDLDDYLRLAQSVAKGEAVHYYGFNWGHIVSARDFSIPTFSALFGKTVFTPLGEQKNVYHEGKGLLMLKDQKVIIAPMSYEDFLRTRCTDQFKLNENLCLQVAEREYENAKAFPELFRTCEDLMRIQQNVMPTRAYQIREYEAGDSAIVKVTRKVGELLEVITVDPNYKPLKGRLHIHPMLFGLAQVPRSVFTSQVREGDLLLVDCQNVAHFPFTIGEHHLNYYYESAQTRIGELCDAVFSAKFHMGNRWMTESGHLVNILYRGGDSDIDDCIENGTPIAVRITEIALDANGNKVLNGICFPEEEIAREEDGELFKDYAREEMVVQYLEHLQETLEVPTAKIIHDAFFSEWTARLFAHLFYAYAQKEEASDLRYQYLLMARMTANIIGANSDAGFLHQEMRFQECLVHFASGASPAALSLVVEEHLKDVPTVQCQASIVEVLKGYKEMEHFDAMRTKMLSEDGLESLRGIVDASNCLIGKIEMSEINRIKKSIAHHLNVADVYQNIGRSATYYGEESDMLEFKSSIVYPSNNHLRPDHTTQKWSILKAICGFLNTTSGGELLLGVNDGGRAIGVNNDLQALLSAQLITEMSMDKYRLYVKGLVDSAFTDENKTASKDITTTRIKYIIERNNEGEDILRIQIRPYEYGVVAFAPEQTRPPHVKDAYYRTSGATTEITAELKKQIWERKLNVNNDEETTKTMRLHQAIKERCCVMLCNYSSSDNTKNRRVEPFKILPEHKSVLCYDLDVSKVRVYKLSRIEKVELLQERWKNIKKHQELNIDIFGMLQTYGVTPILVQLKLKTLAKNLLLEEYKASEQLIANNTDIDAYQYPWVLTTDVYDIKGVGRFYLGLAREIKIVKGTELIAYVAEYANELNNTFNAEAK